MPLELEGVGRGYGYRCCNDIRVSVLSGQWHIDISLKNDSQTQQIYKLMVFENQCHGIYLVFLDVHFFRKKMNGLILISIHGSFHGAKMGGSLASAEAVICDGWISRRTRLYASSTQFREQGEKLGGGNSNAFLFSHQIGEMIQFDSYFSDGLKPWNHQPDKV